MADSTLTTVVVIAHNYGRFLREAVLSVVGQTTPPRIVVIDDASTDDTPEVIQSLRAAHPQIEHQCLAHNIGLSRVRNRAADLVTTEWIVYLDADDWLDASYVERAEAWLRRSPDVDVLTTDMTIVRAERAPRVFRSRVPRFWDDLLERNTIVQTSFIRRAMIQRLGGYDPALDFEDWDFWIRLLQSGGRVARLPGSHVYRREHGQNKSKLCDEAAATAAVLTKHRGRPRTTVVP